MTRMVPDYCPPSVSRGERKMFEFIRDCPDSNSLICLHSLGIARHERKDYAEADFVLICSEGIYCLEVKGGDVQRNNGIWKIGGREKSYSSSEGPFRQAESARWALIAFLDKVLSRPVRKEVLIGWGVAFPDIRFDHVDPEWDLQVVYDIRDTVRPFTQYLARLARYTRTRAEERGKLPLPPISAKRSEEYLFALRGDFSVVQSVAGLMIESNRELIRLSADQHRILDYALNDRNPRLLCDGPAGSGKTLIALEAARRFSKSGKSVLMLCYNRNLAKFLKEDVAKTAPNVTMSTLHGFLADTIRSAGMAGSLNQLSFDQSHLDTQFADLFETACSRLLEEANLPQYDVVIVDEAQDVLSTENLDCLNLVLSNGFRQGLWIIFYDSGPQASLYGKFNYALIEKLRAFGAFAVLLNENFRNPKDVAIEASRIAGVKDPVCKRELRSPVDYKRVDDERDQAKALRALIVQLLKDGVKASNISVLSWSRIENSSVVRVPPDVGKEFKAVEMMSTDDKECISYGTISGFKGLENEIIILTDLPESLDTEYLRAILYVGLTRARTKAYAFVTSNWIAAREQL